jgi:hypothetical protein
MLPGVLAPLEKPVGLPVARTDVGLESAVDFRYNFAFRFVPA